MIKWNPILAWSLVGKANKRIALDAITVKEGVLLATIEYYAKTGVIGK